ncbi:MAG TPA: pirin family protein [Candidatus Acidoferrum sp.]|nr:pirin family protein [Candidatus Acidoferrum sp.]
MSTNPALDAVIVPKLRDLGDFMVRRALPAAQRQRVGPFIFFDQFGPTVLQAGHALDVRPHPHIGLSTLTWLFAGEIQHKDSLGNDVTIRPGEVNWMTAGRGIVHSERSPPSQRQGNAPLGGTQVWLALPLEKEEMAPAFYHYSAAEIPKLSDSGMTLTLIAGTAFGQTSPVHTESDTFYADLVLQAGRRLLVPREVEERAIYVIEGSMTIAGDRFDAGTMAVLKPGSDIDVQAVGASHCVILGGAPLEGVRHLYWNFVSSRHDRIEQAKDDWRHGRFAKVQGDDEFIPLPD